MGECLQSTLFQEIKHVNSLCTILIMVNSDDGPVLISVVCLILQGALVIVGIQLGKLYPKHHSVDGDRNPYCPVNWIECAIKLLQDKPSWQAAKKVFGSDYTLQYDCIIKQHEQLPETSGVKIIADKSTTVDFKASTVSSYFDDTESYISPKFKAHSLVITFIYQRSIK